MELNPRKSDDMGKDNQRIGIFEGRESFVIIDPSAVKRILRYGPKFVEAGAGTGYNAAQIELAGGDVVCYDAAPPDEGENEHFFQERCTYHSVWKNDPDDHSYINEEERTLLLIWPPLEGTMAEDVLRTYDGEWLVYKGEERRGATAAEEFFDLLEQQYSEVDRFPARITRKGQKVLIYRRKEPPGKLTTQPEGYEEEPSPCPLLPS